MLMGREIIRLALVVEVEPIQSLAGLQCLGQLLDIDATTDNVEAELVQGRDLSDRGHKLVQIFQHEKVSRSQRNCVSPVKLETWRFNE